MVSNKGAEKPTIESPCVSNCCLDDEDICLGCGRHIDEITGWHSATLEQKDEIKKKAAARKAERRRPTGFM